MTDKTDIAALTRPVRDRYDWSNAVWRDCDQCGKQHTGTVTAEDGSQICAHCADQLYWSVWQVLAERSLDQLEAERQRAAGSEEELHKALHREKTAERKLLAAQGEIAELKGEQVPFGYVEHQAAVKVVKGETRFAALTMEPKGDKCLPLFTALQSPVISKEKLCDWLEDNFDIDDSQRDAFAQCFAHHCNCIVKKEDE